MDYQLSQGSHDTPNEGRCALEWVAYIAGEAHSDHPQCVDPILGWFIRPWNDDLDGETRQRLRPYLARMIGTSTDDWSEARAWMLTDWLVHEATPRWLEYAGLETLVDQVRVLDRIDSIGSAHKAQTVINEIAPRVSDVCRDRRLMVGIDEDRTNMLQSARAAMRTSGVLAARGAVTAWVNAQGYTDDPRDITVKPLLYVIMHCALIGEIERRSSDLVVRDTQSSVWKLLDALLPTVTLDGWTGENTEQQMDLDLDMLVAK